MRYLTSVCLLMAVVAPAHADGRRQTRNQKIVEAFVDAVFVRHDLDAAYSYLAEDYKQHNPQVATGREAFVAFFRNLFAGPERTATLTVKRTIAQGDLVVVHSHMQAHPGDRGLAVIDIYRVDDGVIVEHWDVLEAVPATSANPNTMF
jgi:predicted SnoaL-like aldol condensation-catalyzing enzyme